MKNFLKLLILWEEFKGGEAPKAKDGVFISRRLNLRVGGEIK
jgi:hypothetical protein